jgi:hypothetical protein
MRHLLLFTALMTTLVLAQERVEFDPNAPDTGAEPVPPPIQAWPLSTSIDQIGRTVTITWPAGTPVEVLSIEQVSHAQRARAFDDDPDELFLVLKDGRRIVLCQGEHVPKQVELVRAVVKKEVEALPMGEGHSTVPAGKPAAPRLMFRAGGSGLAVTHVGPLRAEIEAQKPAIEAGDGATVDGVRLMGKYEIDKHVKAHMPQIAQCYKNALQAKPDLQGKIVVGFVITRDGSVGAAAIQRSTLVNTAVENCIRAQILSIRFPPPMASKPLQISYPFLFSAR